MINYPDYMLYNHFNETFWRKIEHVGFEKVKLMASEIKKTVKTVRNRVRRSLRWNFTLERGDSVKWGSRQTELLREHQSVWMKEQN